MKTRISIKVANFDLVTITDMELYVSYEPALIEIINDSNKFEAKNRLPSV